MRGCNPFLGRPYTPVPPPPSPGRKKSTVASGSASGFGKKSTVPQSKPSARKKAWRWSNQGEHSSLPEGPATAHTASACRPFLHAIVFRLSLPRPCPRLMASMPLVCVCIEVWHSLRRETGKQPSQSSSPRSPVQQVCKKITRRAHSLFFSLLSSTQPIGCAASHITRDVAHCMADSSAQCTMLSPSFVSQAG